MKDIALNFSCDQFVSSKLTSIPNPVSLFRVYIFQFKASFDEQAEIFDRSALGIHQS
jgi:hypothetical protein